MFKIRCSSIGKIMGNPRSKVDRELGLLTKDAQSVVIDQIAKDLYNFKEEISSKYLTKGNRNESEAILLLSRVLGEFTLFKNTKRFEDDFMSGEPDIITKDAIIDVKNSYNGKTFTKVALQDDLDNKMYYYQIQGYMHLLKKKKGYIAYCLTNCDDDLIQREINNNIYNLNESIKSISDEDYTIIENRVKSTLTYDDIDDEAKVKIFQVDYDPKVIEEIQERVVKCREFYDQSVYKLINNKIKNEVTR
ncbi:MAG: hypothetical protein Unbinned2903contig1001_8 [Prokaryotic dsDNA virus sp.]|nr:MAG: hypothetical protein Unbinned2903contig1001_8 [Prokaryotic dsDNA virus sp.]|tara:strand:+ start:2164 stop:2907 length:744 start_codon:yes stop_codon:yes gene_type:complete